MRSAPGRRLTAGGTHSGRILFAQVSERRIDGFFLHNYEYIHRNYQYRLISPKYFLGPAPGFVPLNGTADFAAGHGRHSGKTQAVRSEDHVKKFAAATNAVPVKLREILLFPNPLARTMGLRHQRARRLRPFARRFLITFLPPGVLMRTRNPWVLFRLLLLGRNVGFIVQSF